MKEHSKPTVGQANLLYLIMVCAIALSSILLIHVLGLGANAWVNELAYILLPVLVLARLRRLPVREVCRFRGTARKNILLGMLSGICMWFFALYLSKVIGFLLDSHVGVMRVNLGALTPSGAQVLLLLFSLVILAPICEEIFFRGFVLRAYESKSPKYAFVYAGLLFGLMHIFNGISDVLPACAIGLLLGYIVQRTDSIYPAICAHAANNLSSVMLGGILKTSAMASIPYWLPLTGVAGLMLAALFALLTTKGMNAMTANTQKAMPVTYSIRNVVLLVAAVIVLLSMGSLELLKRIGKI